jgi:hypothetical protein
MPRAVAFEKAVLWDRDTSVTAKNGPMERSTHLSWPVRQESGHSQLGQFVLGLPCTLTAHSDQTRRQNSHQA